MRSCELDESGLWDVADEAICLTLTCSNDSALIERALGHLDGQ